MIFSIIIPTYNNAQYLERAIDSVIHQTFNGKYEIIVINDGSTDSTNEIIASKYSSSNVVRYVTIEHSGVSSARNIGLQMASGDLIMFLDADDYYSPDTLSVVKDCFDQNEIDLLTFGYVRKAGQKEFIQKLPKVGTIKSLDFEKRLLFDSHIMGSVWNKCYRKSILIDISFNTDITHCEDLVFNCIVLQNHPEMNIFISDHYCYYYCENKKSATADVSNLFDEEGELKYINALKYLYKSTFSCTKKRWIRGSIGYFAIDYCYYLRKKKVNNIARKKIKKHFYHNIFYFLFYCRLPIKIYAKTFIKMIFALCS